MRLALALVLLALCSCETVVNPPEKTTTADIGLSMMMDDDFMEELRKMKGVK